MVVALAIVSLVVHLVLTVFFSHTFDSEYWLIIIQNIENGNGLYDLNGYYYTPVWGYFLSFIDALIQASGSIPVLGDRFTDIIMIEDYNGFQAILASPDINFLLKLPLSVCDVVVGVLLYIIVQRYTGSERKGTIAMVLWSFCPIVVYMSAIQGQFDTISVLLLLVTILLIRDNNLLLAGLVFALATWLKIFPGVCLLVLIGYAIARHRGSQPALRSALPFVAGFAVMSAIIFLPQIMDGTLHLTLSFLTSRTSEYSIMSTVRMAFVLLIIVLMMVFMTRGILRKDAQDADRLVFLYCGLIATMATIVQWGYQYAPSAIGFIIIFAMMSTNTRWYGVLYLLVMVFTFLEALFWVNYSALFIASEFLGISDPSWLLSSAIDFIVGLGSDSASGPMGHFAQIWHIAMIVFFILGMLDMARGHNARLDGVSDWVRSFGGRLPRRDES